MLPIYGNFCSSKIRGIARNCTSDSVVLRHLAIVLGNTFREARCYMPCFLTHQHTMHCRGGLLHNTPDINAHVHIRNLFSTFPTLLSASQKRSYPLPWQDAHVSKLPRIPQGGGGGGCRLHFYELGGSFCKGGGGSSMESYIRLSWGGGRDNTFSLSVHDMQQQGFIMCSSCAAAGGASSPRCCTPRGPPCPQKGRVLLQHCAAQWTTQSALCENCLKCSSLQTIPNATTTINGLLREAGPLGDGDRR